MLSMERREFDGPALATPCHLGEGGTVKPTPVSVAEAKESLDRGDRVQFVDARNPTAWSESQVKLPGAIRIPVDGAEEHLDVVPPDSTAIAYCT